MDAIPSASGTRSEHRLLSNLLDITGLSNNVHNVSSLMCVDVRDNTFRASQTVHPENKFMDASHDKHLMMQLGTCNLIACDLFFHRSRCLCLLFITSRL